MTMGIKKRDKRHLHHHHHHLPHQPRQIKPLGTLAVNLDDAYIGVEGMKTGFYIVRSMSTTKVDLDRSSPGRPSIQRLS